MNAAEHINSRLKEAATGICPMCHHPKLLHDSPRGCRVAQVEDDPRAGNNPCVHVCGCKAGRRVEVQHFAGGAA